MASGDPLTERQTRRIGRAMQRARQTTGLGFSVYLGSVGDSSREEAQHLHGRLSNPSTSILLVVAPNQRVVEIVTGEAARRRVPDRICQLAVLSMTAAFGGGDLAGGILAGISHLASHAGCGRPDQA